MTFHYQNFGFFWVYAGFVHFWHQNVDFFEYTQAWWTSSPSNLHILKKIKNLDSEMSPNLHILKKIKRIKNFRLYVGLTGIDELVFDFFEYMHVWWLFTIKILDFLLSICRFCALLASKCWFFWVYAGFVRCWWSKSCIFCFSCRFWRGTSHKTCRRYAILKWTKLKLKPESGFDFLTILSC